LSDGELRLISSDSGALNDSTEKSDDAASLADSQSELDSVRPQQLVDQRVRRFMKLLPEVLNGERAEAVHDLRVWSRRLQEILKVIFFADEENGAASLIRALRRARRSLSEWRDSDVLIALVVRRIRRLHSDEQRAWEVVRESLVKRREKQMHRARRKLAKRELFVVPSTIEGLLKQKLIQGDSNDEALDAQFIVTLSGSIAEASADWQAALARAAESANPADTHNFRICTKRLRYRLELARDLGHKELRSQLISLKALQDTLGEWHDRVELAQSASRALANADFLNDQPRAASLLLRRLARERLAETTKLKSLLGTVRTGPDLPQLEAWVANQADARPLPG
jgi:CHAD domain-containing protein